jgi:hypothetical protein
VTPPAHARATQHAITKATRRTGSTRPADANAATRLLAVIERCGVDLRAEGPDLFEAIRDDPAMFWARGEVQPAGEWHPANASEGDSDV